MNARIRSPLWVAHTQHQYAQMLLRRDDPGDRDKALNLTAALATADQLGLKALARTGTSAQEPSRRFQLPVGRARRCSSSSGLRRSLRDRRDCSCEFRRAPSGSWATRHALPGAASSRKEAALSDD